jgi:hypothetical protein
VTASFAYLRLHGRSKEWFAAENRDARYDYLYSKESLQKVRGKIEKMAAKAQTTFVAANNHPRAQAAANAVELKSLLLGTKAKAPETLMRTYPSLEEFAIPERTPAALKTPDASATLQRKTQSETRRGRKREANEDQQALPL